MSHRGLLADPQVRRWYENTTRGSRVTADVYLTTPMNFYFILFTASLILQLTMFRAEVMTSFYIFTLGINIIAGSRSDQRQRYFQTFLGPSNSEQFIATSKSTNPTDPSSWSTPIRVTTASYGSIGWWDFWPEPFKRGSTYLFYASERNSDGTAMIDGNIWVYIAVPLTN